MLTILNETPSIIDSYLHELRDTEIQKDKHRFEKNIGRIGMLAAYELSRHLNYSDMTTTTPLGAAETKVPVDALLVVPILRAGLPLHKGITEVLDTADSGFVAAARKAESTEGVEVGVDYVSAPELDDKILILADTMLATGSSICDAYQRLTETHGTPKQTFVISVIASQDGVKRVQESMPDAHIIVAAVDPALDENFYIVPGLGDAGDLLYGPKL